MLINTVHFLNTILKIITHTLKIKVSERWLILGYIIIIACFRVQTYQLNTYDHSLHMSSYSWSWPLEPDGMRGILHFSFQISSTETADSHNTKTDFVYVIMFKIVGILHRVGELEFYVGHCNLHVIKRTKRTITEVIVLFTLNFNDIFSVTLAKKYTF